MKKRNTGLAAPLSTFTATLSITMVLIVLGVVVFFSLFSSHLGQRLQENFTVEVLLHDSIDAPSLQELEQGLKQSKYTHKVVYISKEEATRNLAKLTDERPEDFLGESPVSASYELYLKADYANKDSLERYLPAVKQHPAVVDVVYPDDLMDLVDRNIRIVNIILLGLATLLGIISISLINNVVRMNVAQRKASIRTMTLVGAPWAVIRRPFLFSALGLGCIAATCANALLYLTWHGLLIWDASIADVAPFSLLLWTALAVFVFGLLFTFISAYFSVNKYLFMSRDQLMVS